MQSIRKTQLLLILIVCGLIALIFFNGRNKPSALVKDGVNMPGTGQTAATSALDFNKIEAEVKKQLSKQEAEELSRTEKAAANLPEKEKALRLAVKYDSLQQPALAGFYYQRVAEAEKNNEKYWYLTGKKFFEAQAMAEDSSAFVSLMNLSTEAYRKTIALNPQNLDAKAELAVNYIEGTANPMQGVGLLREVIQADSTNKKALLYLGIFSMRSNQYPKAIERFEKLIALDPLNPYYYRYLADAYLASGRKADGKKALLKYKSMVQDARLRKEADEVLNTLN